jgi:hypothetical protein
VQAIKTEFDRKRFTLASVQKFKDREVVKSSVKRLKDAFADKLAKYEA